MSHEIRTPLNAIMAFADLLQRGWEDTAEERNEMLTTIRNSGRHLMTVINDILDLSKIESGQLDLDVQPVSPHSVMSEVVSLMRVPFQEKSLTLDYTWQGPIPAHISTDGQRLRQVLINLLGNARKFTLQGGVQMIARIEPKDQQSRLVVDVIDTGIGIPAEKQDAIFEPFIQADTSVTRNFGGTGLGLSISRRLVRMLGGELTVESEVGKGSHFQIQVPAGEIDRFSVFPSRVVGDVVPAPQKSDAAAQNSPSLQGMRVLVVDDGETNRRVIAAILKRSGAVITSADNGRTACDLVLGKNPFDVILLDMQMPVMDGYTAASTLRSAGVKTPIIALTAHAMREDREKCLHAGCSDYLSKPINADELLARLNELFAAKAPAAPPVTTAAEVQPIYSKLPTDDPEFAEIAADFVCAVRTETTSLQKAVKDRDPVATLSIAHWIKGAGGTSGFPCFTYPAGEICNAVRNNDWSDVDRHLIAIVDYCARLRTRTVAELVV